MARALLIVVLSAATLSDGRPSVAGRIVADESGEAITNARVLVVAAGRTVSFAITDADGRFSLMPPAIPYTLIALKSEYIRREVMTRDAQNPLELRLVRAAVISGRVIDRMGEPIVDARVAAEAPTRAKDQPSMLAVTSTDEAGEFRLAGLGAGSFVVVVTTMSLAGKRDIEPGVARYDSQLAKTYYPESDRADAADVITLAAGEEHPSVDIVVPATQIGGVPFSFARPARPNVALPKPDASGSIAGRVTTADGRPLVHAVVRLIGAFAPAPDQSATSDAHGRYRFEGLAAGMYRVAAWKSGYAPLNERDLVLPGMPMLAPGRRLGSLRIRTARTST